MNSYMIGANVAKHTEQQAKYMQMGGLDDMHYQGLIVGYLQSFQKGKLSGFEKCLITSCLKYWIKVNVKTEFVISYRKCVKKV